MADKKSVGEGSYYCLCLFSLAAFTCGLFSTSWCAFASRDIEIADSDFETACQRLAVVSNVTNLDHCQTFLDHHAVGFYGWQVVVPENQRVCLSYTQHFENRGWVTPPLDSKFNGAGWCAVLANILGGIAFVSIWLAMCCPMENGRIKVFGCIYFLATLFQGLTLLLLTSSVCTKGFFEVYFPTPPDGTESVIQNVSCSLGVGSQLAISATVFYFCCMCLVPTASVPTMNEALDDEEPPAAAASPGEEEAVEEPAAEKGDEP